MFDVTKQVILTVFVLNNMKIPSNKSRSPTGFSLAELLAALTIGAMILVAVLGIYSRAERSAAAITRKLDGSRLPREILQLIAEDLDKIITADDDIKITIENKFAKGLPTAKLAIQKTITDKDGKQQIFEEIIWQSSFDFDANSLVLYRSHSGIALEDKLLDEKRADWEKEYPFVPVCDGLTYFRILAQKEGAFQNKWTDTSLPAGINVTLSFASPYKSITGDLDVPDSEKISRTIAIDRTRKLKFILAPTQEQEKQSK
jgi:prepilin-type N-terminal cleavage/methylation domain-containing protein